MAARACAFVAALAFSLRAAAHGAGETVPRPIPPPGIPVPEDVRAELTSEAANLAKKIEELGKSTNFAGILRELPNIEIFHKAVDWALRDNEFFDQKQFAIAREQLQQGQARLAALQKTNPDGVRNPPWNSATGLVVRAYRSKIDGSVQPYGLVIPPDWKSDDGKAWPLHFWCHGRAEKLTELAFIAERQRSPGEFSPAGAIVCHLYGRYCNANKFAGERDLFEALDDIKKHYRIDEQRLAIRGFSMGGAAAWQFGTHYAGMWAAVAPGAGFAETAEFFKVFLPGKTPPPWWEQVLWRWYDATLYAGNLANTKTIAYSGEIDGQKQAADIMLRFAKKEGVEFPHIIGPQTAHKYHPESKPPIEEFITAAENEARGDFSKHIRVTTYSLIYPAMEWLRIVRLDRHWERADVDAKLEGNRLIMSTRNVTALLLSGPFAEGREETERLKTAIIDGQVTPIQHFKAGVRFHRAAGQWQPGPCPEYTESGAWKTKFVCGPIDHAFMSSFHFVKPTGKPMTEAVGAWTESEFAHAYNFWRKTFRGEAPVVSDTAVTDEQIQNSNLILWGDPSSNAVLKRIADKLPFRWTRENLDFRGVKYDPAHHALVLIFPNPLNPEKYVVLNSGPTFREEALLNNSDQTPKLPDWAVIDLRTPPGPKWPGLVVDAGFFDEQWK